MPSVTRSPIKPPNKYHSGKSELLFHVRISFQDQKLWPETEVLTLADKGCQVLAVEPSKCFPKASWVDAPHLVKFFGGGEYVSCLVLLLRHLFFPPHLFG